MTNNSSGQPETCMPETCMHCKRMLS